MGTGKRHAAQVLGGLEGPQRVALQPRELVIPAKDRAASKLSEEGLTSGSMPMPSHVIYGNNLLAPAPVLAGDAEETSLRGHTPCDTDSPRTWDLGPAESIGPGRHGSSGSFVEWVISAHTEMFDPEGEHCD